MISPPRTAELLLETLGAEPAMRDAVVGDLAEEYAWIADAVGEKEARRWYRRETLHAIPLLLRSSLRNLTWGDVRRRVGIAFSAFALSAIINIVLSVLVAIVFRIAAEIPFGAQPASLLLLVAFKLLLAVPAALLAGYVAAWLDDRTPLLSAATLALPWFALGLGHTAFHGAPLGPMVAQSLASAGLIVLGGLLRLRHRAAHKSASSRTA